jgi:hypothetical protein
VDDARSSVTAVPRVAAFDDLRVGQLIARTGTAIKGTGYAYAGRIIDVRTDIHPPTVYCMTDDDAEFTCIGRNCEAGEVVILRDVPEPPVTVRREDFDALVMQRWAPEQLLREKVDVLIENAEVSE